MIVFLSSRLLAAGVMNYRLRKVKNMRLLKTYIPFQGFYETVYDTLSEDQRISSVEWAEDQAREAGIAEKTIDSANLNDVWIDCANYADMHIGIAKIYVSEINEYICDILKDSKINKDHTRYFKAISNVIHFERLICPKEYNFRNDAISGYVDLKAIFVIKYILFNQYREELEKYIDETCSHRSGFYSFYSNDINYYECRYISNYDINECFILLSAFVNIVPYLFASYNWEMHLFEKVQERFSNEWDNMPKVFDWQKWNDTVDLLMSNRP